MIPRTERPFLHHRPVRGRSRELQGSLIPVSESVSKQSSTSIGRVRASGLFAHVSASDFDEPCLGSRRLETTPRRRSRRESRRHKRMNERTNERSDERMFESEKETSGERSGDSFTCPSRASESEDALAASFIRSRACCGERRHRTKESNSRPRRNQSRRASRPRVRYRQSGTVKPRVREHTNKTVRSSDKELGKETLWNVSRWNPRSDNRSAATRVTRRPSPISRAFPVPFFPPERTDGRTDTARLLQQLNIAVCTASHRTIINTIGATIPATFFRASA